MGNKQREKLSKQVDFFEVKKYFITVVRPREEKIELDNEYNRDRLKV